MRSEHSLESGDSLWSRCRAVLWGGAAGAAVILLLLLLITAIYVRVRRIPQGAEPLLMTATAMAGALVGGFAAGRLSGRRGLLCGLLTGLLLFGVLFLCGEILGSESPGTPLLVKLGLMLLSGSVGGVFGVNRRRRIPGR